MMPPVEGQGGGGKQDLPLSGLVSSILIWKHSTHKNVCQFCPYLLYLFYFTFFTLEVSQRPASTNELSISQRSVRQLILQRLALPLRKLRRACPCWDPWGISPPWRDGTSLFRLPQVSTWKEGQRKSCNSEYLRETSAPSSEITYTHVCFSYKDNKLNRKWKVNGNYWMFGYTHTCSRFFLFFSFTINSFKLVCGVWRSK